MFTRRKLMGPATAGFLLGAISIIAIILGLTVFRDVFEPEPMGGGGACEVTGVIYAAGLPDGTGYSFSVESVQWHVECNPQPGHGLDIGDPGSAPIGVRITAELEQDGGQWNVVGWVWAGPT